MNKTEIKNAVNTVIDYVETLKSGCSFWIDEEGKMHTADMGYVFEFLFDLKTYLENKEQNQ